ncbi:acetyltransferase [Curtobacterium sp. MCPF17_018]|uniref:acyltransferase family protein n=1 Tax=Curtobacterium sp. MCPF17_018 TaxID=2175638 RepID=UPI000DA99D5B|nr:acyltransferase family protein [Curtobacterium sp. MCPF17_018]PZE69287.1 acetyltransferase [Curtobacterium sp. MCPF17_018]
MTSRDLQEHRPGLTAAGSEQWQRFPAFDALRAVGLVAVIVFHVAPAVLPGGYAGVDLFFVISGFLITTLLLREYQRTGEIRLGLFFRRRARRLVPAAVVVVAMATTAAAMLGGDVLVGVPAQLVGVATFSSNWQQLLAGSDYFAHSRTGLFDNFWSLAIEEQFYLVWPVMLLLTLRRHRTMAGRWMWVAIVLAAVVPVVLGAAGHLDAAYLATPAHAFGLLLGSALAVMCEKSTSAATPTALVATAWTVLGAVALLAFVVLAAAPFAAVPTHRPVTTIFGALLGAVMILAAVRGSERVGTWLDAGPLGWLGRRSYGAYLWHLPLIVLADAALPGSAASGNVTGRLTAVAATLVLAAVSYRWVESEVRHVGFRALLRRPKALGCAAIVVVALAGSTVHVARTAPTQTTVENAIGQTDQPSSGSGPSTSTQPQQTDGEEHAAGGDMVAIGDSVMLASKYELEQTFPGITVDAVESRQLTTAPELVRSHLKAHPNAQVVVIGLGVNGVGGESDLDAAIVAAGDRQVVLVDVSAPVSWESTVNAAIDQVASTHTNVHVADWRSEARSHPELIASDGIHPGDAGGKLYAAEIKAALARGR